MRRQWRGATNVCMVSAGRTVSTLSEGCRGTGEHHVRLLGASQNPPGAPGKPGEHEPHPYGEEPASVGDQVRDHGPEDHEADVEWC